MEIWHSVFFCFHPAVLHKWMKTILTTGCNCKWLPQIIAIRRLYNSCGKSPAGAAGIILVGRVNGGDCSERDVFNGESFARCVLLNFWKDGWAWFYLAPCSHSHQSLPASESCGRKHSSSPNWPIAKCVSTCFYLHFQFVHIRTWVETENFEMKFLSCFSFIFIISSLLLHWFNGTWLEKWHHIFGSGSTWKYTLIHI